jgi:hypothetical protein
MMDPKFADNAALPSHRNPWRTTVIAGCLALILLAGCGKETSSKPEQSASKTAGAEAGSPESPIKDAKSIIRRENPPHKANKAKSSQHPHHPQSSDQPTAEPTRDPATDRDASAGPAAEKSTTPGIAPSDSRANANIEQEYPHAGPAEGIPKTDGTTG